MNYLKTTGAKDEEPSVAQQLAGETFKFLPTDVLIPIVLIAGVAAIEVIRTSGTSVLGLLVAAPLVSAIFGRPREVSFIAALTLVVTGTLCVYEGSEMNSEENVMFLVVLAFSILAIAISNLRLRKDDELTEVLRAVAELEVVEKVAVTDWLTGQKNRRGVAQALEEANKKFHSVVMFDLDGLKKINDSLGHKVGDVYVKTITSRIAANFNQDDIFGRWGGDEFVAILALEETQAVKVVERVIEAVHSTPIITDGIEIEARVSAGVAPWEHDEALDAILAKADEALYGAKAHGGSQVLGYTAHIEELSKRTNGG